MNFFSSHVTTALSKQRVLLEFQIIRKFIWRNSIVTLLTGAVSGALFAKSFEITIKEGALIGSITIIYSMAVGILIYMNPLLGITTSLLTTATYLTGYYYGSSYIRDRILSSSTFFIGITVGVSTGLYNSIHA